MPGFILSLWHQIVLSLPLFVLIALGYGLIRWGKWPASITDGLTRFVFSLALPAMLFRMMCDFSQRPAVDARLLIAFFGSCLIGSCLAASSPGISSGWMASPDRCLRWAVFSPIT